MRKIVFVAAMLAAQSAWSHGGGLNTDGCHNNRKTGDYHCHRAPPPPQQSSAPERTAAQRAAPAQQSPGGPTCHVGPRGGTYTITKSGRKNYAGC